MELLDSKLVVWLAIGGGTALVWIICMAVSNHRSSKRIIQTAMGLPEPDASEHVHVHKGRADIEIEAMRERLHRKVGEEGRVDIQTYDMLDGTTGIIGSAYTEPPEEMEW